MLCFQCTIPICSEVTSFQPLGTVLSFYDAIGQVDVNVLQQQKTVCTPSTSLCNSTIDGNGPEYLHATHKPLQIGQIR